MVHRYVVHCYDTEVVHVHQSVGHGALLCCSVTVFVRHVVCCGPLLGNGLHTGNYIECCIVLLPVNWFI